MNRYLIAVVVDVNDDHPEAQGDEWGIINADISDYINDYNRMMAGPAVTVQVLPPIELPEVKASA